MPKKADMRTLMESQYIKGTERVLEYARHKFCHIFWSFRKKIISKNSVLVVSKILRLFVNVLTPDDKYSASVKASV